MNLKEAQKSSTEALKSSENDLKIKTVNVHKTVPKTKKPLIFEVPKASLDLRFASQRLLG